VICGTILPSCVLVTTGTLNFSFASCILLKAAFWNRESLDSGVLEDPQAMDSDG